MSDMELTSSSLDSKETLSCVFKNFVTSRLHSGMSKMSKLRIFIIKS